MKPASDSSVTVEGDRAFLLRIMQIVTSAVRVAVAFPRVRQCTVLHVQGSLLPQSSWAVRRGACNRIGSHAIAGDYLAVAGQLVSPFWSATPGSLTSAASFDRVQEWHLMRNRDGHLSWSSGCCAAHAHRTIPTHLCRRAGGGSYSRELKIPYSAKCAAPHPDASSVVRSVMLLSQILVEHVSFTFDTTNLAA